jgi:hypothetical protein
MEYERRYRCSECDDRVGIYEPLAVEYDDGTVEQTSWLNVPTSRRTTRVWHAMCFLRAARLAA